MRKGLALAALVGAAALALAAGASARPGPAPDSVRSVYFANWDRYARNYFVNQIPADKINQIEYAFAFPTATGCALSDAVVGLRGADVERRQQRRRRRRRSVESEPARVRQLQPAAEAEGRAPEPSHRDLDRRLDGLEVVLRRGRDAAVAAGVRAVVPRPLHPRQPAERPGQHLAAAVRRRRRDRRPLRRNQHRLGVPGNRPRERCSLLARATATTRRCC